MKHRKISRLALYFSFLAMLFVTSCEKEQFRKTVDVTFNATIEQPDNGDRKIVLVDEEWIYWEIGDEISIGSQHSSGNAEIGYLVNAQPSTDFGDFNGVFIASLPEYSSKFLGLHPYNENNIINGTGDDGSPYFSTPTLCLAFEQPLRHDSTFSRKIFPMVAWYDGLWDDDHPEPFNLDFHSLGAIVRVQLFNNTDEKNISKIVFTSADVTPKKLSGAFTVQNFNTADPHLEAVNDGLGTSVAITCGDKRLGSGDLLSFYLVLPAIAGRGTTTNYRLEMDVQTSDNKHCKKTFTVGTRRTGITYMRALGIDEWSDAGNGAASAGLVGCGTATRPFKIYTLADLQYLRDCYNSVERKINNVPITNNTHIALMRSDIVLTSADWTEGITNFQGVFTSRLTAAGEKGITNNSQHALFESIGENGKVDGLTVISGITLALHAGYEDGFSPFCLVNHGIIKDCNTLMNGLTGLSSTYTDLAGICVTNDGTLQGCSNNTTITVGDGRHVGGICLKNNAGKLIKGCQVTSEFTVSGNAKVGGICYENNGTVRDSFFGSRGNTSSTSSWGTIVYNSTGTVEHCYCSHTASIVTTDTVGGIVNINSGTVKSCYSEGQLQGKCIGGIVAKLTNGKVINCYIDNSLAQIILNASGASDYGGGLVGCMSGGNIQNCYINITTVRQEGSTGVRGGLVGKVTGGKVSNCYANERSSAVHSFYGSTDVATTTRFEYCYLVSGTQAGITDKSTSDASSSDASAGLTALLNNHKPEGALSWLLSEPADHPILEAYTLSPTKHRR